MPTHGGGVSPSVINQITQTSATICIVAANDSSAAWKAVASSNVLTAGTTTYISAAGVTEGATNTKYQIS